MVKYKVKLKSLYDSSGIARVLALGYTTSSSCWDLFTSNLKSFIFKRIGEGGGGEQCCSFFPFFTFFPLGASSDSILPAVSLRSFQWDVTKDLLQSPQRTILVSLLSVSALMQPDEISTNDKLMDKYFFPPGWWGERCQELLQIGKPVMMRRMIN